MRQSHRTIELLYASLQFHQELPNTRHVTRYHTFVPAAFEYLQDRRSQGILVPPRSVHNISIGLLAGSLPTGGGRDRALTTAVAVATAVSHGQAAAPEANTDVMHTSWSRPPSTARGQRQGPGSCKRDCKLVNSLLIDGPTKAPVESPEFSWAGWYLEA